MLQRPAIIGASARPEAKGLGSIACLAFVAFLAVAFWAGAVWIGETIIRLLATA